MGKILKTVKGILLLLRNVKIFDPEEVFRNKRVAIIGAAESAFEVENAAFIESFDLVIRVNKALHTWRPDHEKYIGKRTDILFHSFFENEESGGGPINVLKFKNKHGLLYLVHPRNNLKGYRIHLNFYKRNMNKIRTFLLSRKTYGSMEKDFDNYIPTTGYAALFSVLNAPCKEIYITGFTFFKTPYAIGYRDHLREKATNSHHIEKQGLHNPDLEFDLFKKYLKKSKSSKIHLDKALKNLLQQENNL